MRACEGDIAQQLWWHARKPCPAGGPTINKIRLLLRDIVMEILFNVFYFYRKDSGK
jgi:hypothetical protein